MGGNVRWGMASLLGIVVPLALAASISPTVLALQLLTLSRKNAPVPRAWAIAGGCALVLVVLSGLGLAFVQSTGGSKSPSEAGAIVKLVAAGLLGPRATPVLERLNGVFTAHRRGIGAGLCLTFAVFLAVAAVKALT